MSSKEHVHQQLVASVQKAESYKAMLETEAGKDLLKFINDEYVYAQNEIIKDPSERRTCTDTLRGKLQEISSIYNYMNGIVAAGHNASETLARQNQNK